MMMVPILLLLFLCGYEADAEMQLPGGHKIKAFDGNTTQVLVSFTKAYPELLTAVISSDISITINGTINTLHNNGSVNITPSDINTLDYGTYKIEFHLYGNGSSEQVDAVLFYEKSLSGLTVKNNVVETLVNQDTQFSAILTGGSSAVVEWISNFDSLVTYGVCNGSLEAIETTLAFPSAQNYTLTVLVINSLGQNLSAQIDVIVWKPVEGFSFSISPTVASVNETITFTILLDNNNRLPMGNIIFNISFGDGINDVSSDNVASDLTTNGIIFKHTYDKQGNYSITSYAYTSLSETKFSRSAFVWNNISLPTAVSYIEIKQNGLFLSDYITNTPFMYYIAYGDNRNKTNSPDIITNNQPLNISEWDNSYASEGIYEIEFEAWNPFYTEKCKYIVKVQNPVPLLTLLPLETSPLSLFPAIPSGVDFTLNMTNENSLPPTNMTCKFCFDSSTCSADKDVDFSSDNFYTINHNYTDTGEMNITVNCSNNVSHGMVTTRIEMLPGIKDFKVTNGYVLSLPTNNFTTSEFSYSQGTLMSTLIKVHADEIIYITGTVDNNTKTGYVKIKEENLPNVSYGSYKVTLELHSISGEFHEIILALFYEEPISGFQVQEEADLVLVNRATSFNVSFTTGSNAEVEIVIRDTESILVSCEGNERINQVPYQYIDAIDYTINSVARNTISSSNTEYTKVKTVKPIKGFDIDGPIDPIDSYTNASLTVKLDNSSRLPMHNLTLNLYYGDLLNSNISFNEHFTDQALNAGYVNRHEYTKQGNYTVKGIMMSSLSSQTMEHVVYVWDNITNLRLTSNRSAVVDEPITFSFINVPRCGFEYKIEYGDKTVEHSPSNILYEDYTETTFSHNYSSPEVYEVSVTLWNPFFKVFHKYLIIIQYPIVDFYLSPQPPAVQYPIPDGEVIFTINMTSNNSDPTNVTCQFSYENEIVSSNDSVDITYNKNVSRIHNYTDEGFKNVRIICSNIVSSVTLTTQIEIKEVELEHFTFLYPPVVPMNMTSNATDIPVSVEFNIALFECVRFPPEVHFMWNFNDSSKVTTQSSSIVHTFTERRRYTISIKIYNNSAETTKKLDIKIGAVDFDVSSFLGGVGITNFTFSMTGLGNGEYELFPGIDTVIQKQQLNEKEGVNIYKVYVDWGSFYPRIIARNENFTEFLYFHEPIVVDYNMSVMQIDMPKTLKMPNPGKVNVTASLVGTTIPLPITSCTYDMQDFIDFSVVTLTHNITNTSPMIYTFEYLTLGDHDVTINCSNNYDTFVYQSTITVTNKCFTIEGIFDRQYARPTTPMIVYTTENFDLANRMGVHCSNQTITFNWDVYRIITIEPENKQRINNTGNEADQANRGAYRFSKGKFQEGLYEIFLNVSLSTTWIPERTYLRFIRPAPIAFIEGGFQRTSKLSNKFLTIDALTSSYDIGLGYGGNVDLNFTWTCYRINASDLDDLANKYEEDGYRNTPCEINETSRGIANLTFEEGIQQGYIVTVKVILENVFAEYTQLTMTVDGISPDIYIRCKLNCDSKYAVTAHSIWEVVCIDCVSAPTYMWKLKEQENVTLDWSEVSNLKTKTGRTKQSFDIEDFSLTQGQHYRIEVSVTDTNGEGQAKWSFFTNAIPYGGVCKAVNHTILGRPPTEEEIDGSIVPMGKAFSTKFAVYCFNWKDEANRTERDASKDIKEPLMYEYIIVQYHKGSNDLDLSTNTSIYKGGESTATDLRLPAGSPDFDYTVGLFVKIIDRFGDYETVNWTVNVTRDESLEPTNVEGANKLFGEYDDSYNITKAGGNDIAVLRLISSTASMYSNILLSNKSATTTEVEYDLTSIEEDTIDDVQALVRQKTNEFVTEISKLVPVNSTIKMLPSDAHLVASTLDECISNQDAITQSASEGITNTTYELMLNIQNASKSNPIPMQELNAIKGGALDVIDVISKNLKFLENTTIEDLNTTLTLEQVELDLREYLLYHPEETSKYPINTETIEALYEKRMTIREKQIEVGNSTEKTTRKLFGCIDTVNEVNSINVAYGQGPYEIKASNLQLTIEKDSVSNLINKTKLYRNGFTFDMENETFTNITDENVEIQVSVLDSSPIIHAGGATNIHGKIVRLTARNDEGNEIHFPVPMTIENEKEAHYAEFDTAIFDDEHDGLMHFRVRLQDDSDALIAYILPEGFDEYTTETYNLTVYATSKITSTVGEYEFEEAVSPLSWTTFGFKVFIPSGTFPKGDIVLSLKSKEVPRNTSGTEGKVRRRRSVDLDNPSNQTFTNISVAIVTTGCRVYDESSNSWTSNGCNVLSYSTLNETLCRCEAGAGNVFASSFFVPNMIDFHSVWSKFDVNNAAIYGTLIALFVLYVAGMVYLRRKDKIDQIKWMPVLLCDNQKSAEYFYLISVYTGLRPGSGTKSNVSFILGGEDGDSGVRLLNDGTSEGIQSKSVRSYIMATPECLGGLTYVRVWHDNSGEDDDASWYLHQIVVEDIQTKEKFVFLCDRWLALDLDDGMVDRLLPVLDKDNAGFESVFSQQTRLNISENHLWLSIVVRPQRSLFTRVQRLSCLMSLLLLTMITNAMFFQTEDEETVIADTVRIGKLRLSLKTAYISVVGVLITVIPIMIITHLFKNTRVKKKIVKDGKQDKSVIKAREITMEEEAKYPHLVIYISWIIVALSIIVPAFFMLLYSMEWGTSKSEEWLTTFVLSFVESLFIVDPLKVLIIALFIAWLIKKPADDINLKIDLDSVREQCKNSTENNSKQFLSFRMEVMSKSGPPVENALQDQRIKRMKEKIAQQAFIEVILQILFAAVIFSISYVNRDDRFYRQKENIDNYLYACSKTQYGFSKVLSQEAFVNWTKQTLIPFTYPTEKYNGKGISAFDKYYVADMENVRVGQVRLRQVRANKDDCIYGGLTESRFCVPAYDTDKENKSLMVPIGPITYTSNAWKYIGADEIWGIAITGLYNTYSGGGFIQNFHKEKALTINAIDELTANKWIDRFTRAVFVEFTLFNPNLNLFSYTIYLAEFSENGGAYNWIDTQSFRATTITDATGAFSILLYIIYLIIIIVLTYKLIKKFRLQGCKQTFTNFWNGLDIVLCTLSYAATVVWIFKYIYTRKAMKQFNDDRDAFINFQHIVVWEYIFTCILGGLCFAATLRILSALKYNKKLTEVADVLRKGANPICQFAVMFMCVFFNFVGFGYLLFGSTVREYRNMFIAFGSLTNTLIGRNSLDSMISASPAFAELYFFVYVFFVIFTLMTMFSAILNESISEVRHAQAADTIGIMQLVKTTMKDILSLVGVQFSSSTSKRTKDNPRGKQKYNNDIDTSNVLGLIRETLGDFKSDDEQVKPKDSLTAPEDEGNKDLSSKLDVRPESRPCTAQSVKIILPDGTEAKDNEGFYEFYKGYL